MSNMGTVREIYEAFGRGDVPAILNKLDDNVEWETQNPFASVPWLQSHRGKASITAFFESLAPLKITRFEPHTFFESGDKVFVLIAFEAINREKNYSFPNNGHLWQFKLRRKSRKVRPHYRHCPDDQDGEGRMTVQLNHSKAD